MYDLNERSINHANVSIIQNDPSLLDREYLENLNQLIQSQYISFNNLGINYLKNIDYNYTIPIYEELLDYVNENYLSIVNYDDTIISSNKVYEIGSLVYNFICVDCYCTIIPKYLENINCFNIKDFEIYLSRKYKNDVSNFKTAFIKTIESILNPLIKLKGLDKSIEHDAKYINYVKKYAFYIELINYGDNNNFLFNYFKCVLQKNESDLIWRV